MPDPITTGLSLAKYVAQAAAAVAEQAKNQQQIDSGKAIQMAESAKELYETLKKIRGARDAVGVDAEYTERVLDESSRDD